MSSDSYTPDYSDISVRFMGRRRAQTHAAFLLPYLSPGLSILDCGCGPGTISGGLAEAVYPGPAIGVDVEESQIELAQLEMWQSTRRNLSFQVANAYALPFEAESFDVIFAHALFEHLDNPLAVLGEFRRIMRPGGMVAVCSPDWGGSVVAPSVPGLALALETFTSLIRTNGEEPLMGRRLSGLLAQAGFGNVAISAHYEFENRWTIAEYMAHRLDLGSERARDALPNRYRAAAKVLRSWCKNEPGLFAQAWVAAIGRDEV